MKAKRKAKRKDKKDEVTYRGLLLTLAVALVGYVTPLINFEVGVAGFIVLLLWIGYTIRIMRSTKNPTRLILIVFVLIASHRLLFYAFWTVLFSPCWFTECNLG